MTNYNLVFDMGGPWTLYGARFLLIIPAVMALGLAFNWLLSRKNQTRSNRFLWFAFIFCGGISAVLIVHNYAQGDHLRQLAEAGHAVSVEGCLKSFHPADHDGHDAESFTIGNLGFSFNEGDDTAGFHHTQSHGGPIHADSRLKLKSVDGVIVRLEVLDHACLHAPDDN